MEHIAIMGEVLDHEADRIEEIFHKDGDEAGIGALAEVVCKAGGVLLETECAPDNEIGEAAMALSVAMMGMYDETKDYDAHAFSGLFHAAYEAVDLDLHWLNYLEFWKSKIRKKNALNQHFISTVLFIPLH